MDDNNSRDDRGLKVLLDMWNNDDPRWFSTNEFDDLLANLHALDAMLEASARKPVLWKWVIIATHTTLQSLAVCKLTRTDGFGAKDDATEKQMAAFYEARKNTLDDYEEFSKLAADERIANFPVLMRRLGYDVPKSLNDADENDIQSLALFFLHAYRSTYAHYPPGRMTLDAKVVRNIVKIAVGIISVEIHKDDWKRRPFIALENVTPILESIISNLRKIV